MVGANSWELARSARVFPNIAACERAIEALVEGIARGQTVIAQASGTGAWSWDLLIDGAPVAVASRLYGLERECDYALRAFLKAVSIAPQSLLVPRRPHRGSLSSDGRE